MDELAKNPNGQLEIKSDSGTASAISLVRMLNLAATVTGYKELTEPEIRLWLRLLTPYPAEHIESAFERYLETGQFFPKPADILAILNAASEEKRARREADETTRMLEENRQMRERLKKAGLPYGTDQYRAIMDAAIEHVKKLPEPEPNSALRQKIALVQKIRERAK